MYRCGVYHSDIKSGNISFYRHAEYDEFEPKLIDFGGASTEFRRVISFTPFYFYNSRTRI